MYNEIPAHQVPSAKEVDEAPRENPVDLREQNGTGEHADEEQLGVTEEEVDDLEDDAKGG